MVLACVMVLARVEVIIHVMVLSRVMVLAHVMVLACDGRHGMKEEVKQARQPTSEKSDPEGPLDFK